MLVYRGLPLALGPGMRAGAPTMDDRRNYYATLQELCAPPPHSPVQENVIYLALTWS